MNDSLRTVLAANSGSHTGWSLKSVTMGYIHVLREKQKKKKGKKVNEVSKYVILRRRRRG